jgi:glycosyltransferase involved in cell wall biosynthesis
VRIAFLLPDFTLSGGAGIVVEHARRLARDHGMDVVLVPVRGHDETAWSYPGLSEIRVATLREVAGERFDVAVATWWETALSLFDLNATRYAYFLQLLEDSHYPERAPQRLGFQLTLGMPVRFLTAARWIRDFTEAVQPGSRALYVRSGIDKDVFRSPETLAPALSGPLRIVIEGNVDLPRKATPHALAAVGLMRSSRYVTLITGSAPREPLAAVDDHVGGLSHREMAAVFARSHVLLKLSRAEGMFGPPLEAFHMGCTCVVNPVTGHDDYIEHLNNGLVVDWDDPLGTARALDLLASDRRLLHRLRLGALDTARSWPSWSQASAFMALALRRIVDEPAPEPATSGRTTAGGIALAMSDADTRHVEAEAARQRTELILEQRAVQLGITARRYATPALQVMRRVRRRVGRR